MKTLAKGSLVKMSFNRRDGRAFSFSTQWDMRHQRDMQNETNQREN